MKKHNLVDEIIQNMPQGLTDLEKARYVYIELGKQRRFDANFFYGNIETIYRIYESALNAMGNSKKINNKRTLMCVTLSAVYREILQQLGIKCMIFASDNSQLSHRYPIVFIKDEKGEEHLIKADISEDLTRIQIGARTTEFGTYNKYNKKCSIVDPEVLRQIDQKINYIQQNQYRDIYRIAEKYKCEGIMGTTRRTLRMSTKMFRERFRGYRKKNRNFPKTSKTVQDQPPKKSSRDLLRSVLNDPEIYSNTNFQGHIERRIYYKELLMWIFGRRFNRSVFILSCYKDRDEHNETGEPKKIYTSCVFSYENNQLTPYLYCIPLKRFLPVSLEQLVQFRQQGLVIGMNKHVKGYRKMHKTLDRTEKRMSELVRD